ncbi:MAG: DNA gyrase inhibitor YacG [Gammaproteobacteria bacterium]|nr:DNA gyrase inhibitor YacG [Gammaproteobacteria bacterium]
MVKKVKCPTCGKETEWKAENKWRPFCSERCKLIDLGEWANESHRIPGEELPIPSDNDDDPYSGYH